MHSKRSVTLPSGDGDSYEEEGDNIDMMVAPAFEDSLASTHQSGKPLSLYFENLQNCVETQTIAVQTVEEMVPKSEVQILAKSFSVDSSTNTEIVETSADTSPPKVDLNNVSTSCLVDCSTNTDLLDADDNNDSKSALKKSCACTVEMSTNTDNVESPSVEEQLPQFSNGGLSIKTETLKQQYDQDHVSNLCTENSTAITTDAFDSGHISTGKNIDSSGPSVKKDSIRNKNDFKLTRNSRISGLEENENSVELVNFASRVGITTSKVKYDLRPIKPLIGPRADTVYVIKILFF